MRISDWSSDVCSSDLSVAQAIIAVDAASIAAVERRLAVPVEAGRALQIPLGHVDPVAASARVIIKRLPRQGEIALAHAQEPAIGHASIFDLAAHIVESRKSAV